MTRDDLIDTASQAMHDLFDRPGTATNREYAAAVVDAVEPVIRADERWSWTISRAAEASILADLRAKVEALRDEAAEASHYSADEAYDNVLALIDWPDL